jgi:hypothetical protein
MGRVDRDEGADRGYDEARAWLAEQHPLPPLADRSPEGRRAFLDAHEAVLWAFWRDAFSLAYADGSLRPAAALGAAWVGANGDAGAETADRLIRALRDRPTLEEAPAWIHIERWHGWLLGEQASAARREPRGARRTAPSGEETHGGGGAAADDLVDLRMLLERWVVILGDVIAGTGIPSIEFDWLWATRHARKPLSHAFLDDPAFGRLSDADLDACVRRSSAPGDSAAERTRRSRAGACAAFRFNLEEIARRAGPQAIALAAAKRVFIGPVEPRGPIHRPKVSVDADASAGFWEALRRSEALSAAAPEDGPVDRLWKGAFACGLNRSVLRLLPPGIAALLEGCDLDALLSRPGERRPEGEDAS